MFFFRRKSFLVSIPEPRPPPLPRARPRGPWASVEWDHVEAVVTAVLSGIMACHTQNDVRLQSTATSTTSEGAPRAWAVGPRAYWEGT